MGCEIMYIEFSCVGSVLFMPCIVCVWCVLPNSHENRIEKQVFLLSQLERLLPPNVKHCLPLNAVIAIIELLLSC